ncbi:two pore potassium channel protein sup-9 [Anthonomus grandis grandis]|uniref:two pore potassium channel protein sup-9 n=1 Tax=Anthonomus grandis grandis TaxID=2921223 RepID=UPI00216554E4|nr:two pore potassium channel protein sup-9 [Anthonomus grandis grandis]
MKKQNVRTLSLIVCTFTYLLTGAAFFDALESETEAKRKIVLQDIQVIIRRKYNISDEDFRIMETIVMKSEPHRAGQQWKFTGAFYYATTVLTTIGYGHSTPSTIAGKMFTMMYAMIGIPLGLVMFQSIGERVNKLSSVIIRSVRSSLHCKRTTASELDLICVVTFLSSLTILGGAAAFSRYEGWSYFDSVYYCFITLTTIGFGDMVALQKDNALSQKPEYVMFSLIFILFGLAIVAASLNLLVLRFVTMNTEDERRDEAQAIQAMAVAVRLDGDVITANGSILSGHLGLHCTETTSLDIDDTSVCSCPCGCIPTNNRRKWSSRRSPTQIRHLLPVLPMHELHLPNKDVPPPPAIYPNHRASI